MQRNRVGWFKLEPTEQIQARWWLRRREDGSQQVGERRTDPSVASDPHFFLELQVIRARLWTCFRPVFTRVSNRADSGGNTEMALNNTESYGKKVPLPFPSTPADYSRRKSLVPANMSLTPL